MKKNTLLLLFALLLLPLGPLRAQYAMGTTGLLNIPTAEWNPAGTIKLGANFLTKEILPKERFTYNTYNFFATAQIFSFIEVSFRELGFKASPKWSEIIKDKWQLDRSFSVRVNLLREKKWWPSIAIGGHDIGGFQSGSHFYEAYYGVLTKGFDLGRNRLSLTAGYSYGRARSSKTGPYHNRFDGVFGGLCFQPAGFHQLKLMAEYDTMGFNAGAALTLWKRLAMHCFTHDFKGVVAGIRYECTLLH